MCLWINKTFSNLFKIRLSVSFLPKNMIQFDYRFNVPLNSSLSLAHKQTMTQKVETNQLPANSIYILSSPLIIPTRSHQKLNPLTLKVYLKNTSKNWKISWIKQSRNWKEMKWWWKLPKMFLLGWLLIIKPYWGRKIHFLLFMKKW